MVVFLVTRTEVKVQLLPFLNFVHPVVSVFFRRDIKNCWSLPSSVYASRSKITPHGVNRSLDLSTPFGNKITSNYKCRNVWHCKLHYLQNGGNLSLSPSLSPSLILSLSFSLFLSLSLSLSVSLSLFLSPSFSFSFSLSLSPPLSLPLSLFHLLELYI